MVHGDLDVCELRRGLESFTSISAPIHREPTAIWELKMCHFSGYPAAESSPEVTKHKRAKQ